MAKAASTKNKVSDIEYLKPEDAIAFLDKVNPSYEGLEVNNKPVMEEKAELPKPSKASDTNLSFEERIEAYIEDKKDYVKLNDFLKSLYPIPKFNEPPVYLNKGEMKRMRILLDNMQSHGKIEIKDNGHGKLGNHYYEGEQQYAKFYHIGNLTIEAKK